ncbi:MAG: hypothetical protein JWP96_2780 [Polaromonas sp.]|nr:hypothetical protein [Polaromonas sp.]
MPACGFQTHSLNERGMPRSPNLLFFRLLSVITPYSAYQSMITRERKLT